MLQSNTSFGS